MSIRNRLILYFMIAILIPSTAITGIIYARSTAIIAEKSTDLIEKNLDSVSMIISQRFEFINELTTLISINPVINQVLSTDSTKDMSTNIVEILKLDRALDSYYLSNYYVLPNSSVIPKIYLTNKPDYRTYKNLSNKVRDISEVENNYWYTQMQGKNTIVGAQPEEEVITVARRLYDLKNVDTAIYSAVLTIDINKQYFSELLSSRRMFPSTRMYIVNAEGQVILDSTYEDNHSAEIPAALIDAESSNYVLNAGGKTTNHKIDGEPVIVCVRSMESPGWSLISISYFNDINAEHNQLTRVVLIVLCVCMAGALLLALWFARSISQPIVQLVKSMSSVKDNNFVIDIDYKKEDEFGYLIQRYKHMIIQIQELIQQLYTSERNKRQAQLQAKDAQLQALQAQINPHFLYNTLDSINLYAMRSNIPHISDMIQSLANFYRYSLSGGRDIITLDEELRQVQSYLEIQNMRFENKLNYQIEVPFHIRKKKIVKFVMQPLVENAVLHGLQLTREEWNLKIWSVEEEDCIKIRIGNTGVDADIEKLNDLLLNRGASKSFGIYNVQERIKSVYGDAYGLMYEKNEPQGVIVTITIPH